VCECVTVLPRIAGVADPMKLQSTDSPTQAPRLTCEQQAEVEADQTKLLYSNLPLSVSITVIIAAILAYAMIGHVPRMSVIAWFGAMLLVCSFRIGLWFYWKRATASASASETTDKQHKAVFEVGAFLAGVAWGSASVAIFPAESIAHQVFLGFVLASMTAGGISTLAVHLKSYVIFLLPSLIPYSLRLFIEGGDLQIYMGLVFSIGLCFLLVNAHRFESVTVSALSLHHENQHLVGALRSALHDAENANRAKTQFLAKMSHEIRTPLSGMVGMAELLQKTDLDHHQRRLTGSVSQSAATLQTLVSDLLDISRIESGHFSIEEKPFDLRTCIEDAIEICSGAGYRKGLEIHLVVSDPLPLNVTGDRQRLYQILVDLIGNSVRFIEVGQISLRVACQRRDTGLYDVTFSISDNGIGIPRKDMERLFVPLTRGESESLRHTDGRDLSLAVTRHLVDQMGGTVSLTSDIGKGTTVRFTLPMKPVTDSPVDIETAPGMLAGKRILVIDDRELSREAIASRLQSPAARIETACCEEEAMSKLRRAVKEGAPFDIAIVDRFRPRTDNFSLHRKIVSTPDFQATKVIALMPMQWTLDQDAAAEFGASSFVSKPIRRHMLLSAIETALRPARANAQQHAPPVEEASIDNELDPTAKLRGLNILVAEDNPVNQEVALAYLDGFGCSAKLATNGLDAINAFENDRFDIVLMDCQMPELDGLSAIRHIRLREKNDGLPRIPIVMITANAFASDREQAMQAGADDFLSKPYTEQQLLLSMKQCIARAA
jgi:signal transduction histidine kinase/CheY-like chemotaxis protein